MVRKITVSFQKLSKKSLYFIGLLLGFPIWLFFQLHDFPFSRVHLADSFLYFAIYIFFGLLVWLAVYSVLFCLGYLLLFAFQRRHFYPVRDILKNRIFIGWWLGYLLTVPFYCYATIVNTGVFRFYWFWAVSSAFFYAIGYSCVFFPLLLLIKKIKKSAS